jgi:hypothetical protein
VAVQFLAKGAPLLTALQPLDPRDLTRRAIRCGTALLIGLGSLAQAATQPSAVAAYHKEISPLLEDYCYECHGDGMAKGKVAFDELTDADLTTRPDLWFNALQNLRADIMPPLGKPRPTPEEEKAIARWIKYSAFGTDPNDPDPGRVTIRRMNRIEYGRTVRSLLGVPYPSEAEFPPDDTGHGFDNIADVLSISPLLLEKYLQAADTIITGVVPQTPRVTPEVTASGRDFRDFDNPQDLDEEGDNGAKAERAAMGRPIKYAEAATVSHDFDIARDANYTVEFKLAVHGPFNFDSSVAGSSPRWTASHASTSPRDGSTTRRSSSRRTRPGRRASTG